MPESEDKNRKLTASLEAILFTYGDPISVARLVKILSRGGEVTEDAVREGLRLLEQELRARGSGLSLLFRGDEAQIATRPDLSQMVEAMAKEEFTEELTPAAVETLAIVMYGGEIPRSTIDYIRGVNSSFIVRNLLVRGLLDRIPDPKRANTFRYRPSFALLRHLGIERAEALPEYAKFREMLTKFSPQN